MGVVSIGRSLVIRQLLLAGLIVALGMTAYLVLSDVGGMAQGLAVADPKAATDGVAAMVAAVDAAGWQILIATGVAALLFVVVSIILTHITTTGPMKAMASAMTGLAVGDPKVAIEGEGRNDEIGAMARALQQLRDRIALLVERAERREPTVAETERSHVFQSTSSEVEKFSSDMSSQVQRLATITRRLVETSESMIVAARHASDGSDLATNASSNAAGDVSSVATASEQLLDSIEEISRQVVQSTSVVKAAVERAVETNAGMGRLSTAAQKVGDVVSLISRIAAQTNLLALNATIEAARAGEAGRGFAVVAQEVKTLATQTAKATQDITGQIAEMQEATELSVLAIDKIQKKISEVEHISTIIAAAVHEQGAATQEIAHNVRSAAAGTATMSSHVENVIRSVDETSSSAAAVRALAREFDEVTGVMTRMVDRCEVFAKDLRTAA